MCQTEIANCKKWTTVRLRTVIIIPADVNTQIKNEKKNMYNIVTVTVTNGQQIFDLATNHVVRAAEQQKQNERWKKC